MKILIFQWIQFLRVKNVYCHDFNREKPHDGKRNIETLKE